MFFPIDCIKTGKRAASAADYLDVLSINDNVHDGRDIIPNLYSQWLEEERRRSFVATKNDEIVGFVSVSWYTSQKWTVFVCQGLRARSDIAGTNFTKLVVDWITPFLQLFENPVLLRIGLDY